MIYKNEQINVETYLFPSPLNVYLLMLINVITWLNDWLIDQQLRIIPLTNLSTNHELVINYFNFFLWFCFTHKVVYHILYWEKIFSLNYLLLAGGPCIARGKRFFFKYLEKFWTKKISMNFHKNFSPIGSAVMAGQRQHLYIRMSCFIT